MPRQRLGLGLTASLVLAACGSHGSPGCRTALLTKLPANALTAMAGARLDRAGAGFVLIGADDAGGTVRFAPVSTTGAVGAVTTVVLPTHTLGPFYGVTGKTMAGDQLLVVYGVGGDAGVTALELIVASAGTAAMPRPLTDPTGAAVSIPPDGLAHLQASMGSSSSGQRAIFAWGFTDQVAAPSFLLLGADGAPQSPASLLGPGRAPWDCLAITASRKTFGISQLVRPASGPAGWQFFEFDDAGAGSASFAIDLSTDQAGCPAVGPTPKGYALAWQNRDGTYFADLDDSSGTPLVASHIVKGAVRFGGPDRQPPLAAIAPMGKNFAITYGGSAGPQIDRFDVYGTGQGDSLFPTSRGHVGPVSAWPSLDATWLSYLDHGGQASDDVRYLTEVICPEP